MPRPSFFRFVYTAIIREEDGCKVRREGTSWSTDEAQAVKRLGAKLAKEGCALLSVLEIRKEHDQALVDQSYRENQRRIKKARRQRKAAEKLQNGPRHIQNSPSFQ